MQFKEEYQTRWGYIKENNLDLTDYRTFWDVSKFRYKEPTFWNTLDSKIVAFSFKIPYVGVLIRLLAAIIPLGINRYEPFPIGNNSHVNNLWKNDPDWKRWIKWHGRNMFTDLRKFYFGIAYATNVRLYSVFKHESDERVTELQIRSAKFSKLPFRLPIFPEFKSRTKARDGWQIIVGFKGSGLFGITIKNEGE